jgi:hypothetical protein
MRSYSLLQCATVRYMNPRPTSPLFTFHFLLTLEFISLPLPLTGL